MSQDVKGERFAARTGAKTRLRVKTYDASVRRILRWRGFAIGHQGKALAVRKIDD